MRHNVFHDDDIYVCAFLRYHIVVYVFYKNYVVFFYNFFVYDIEICAGNCAV